MKHLYRLGLVFVVSLLFAVLSAGSVSADTDTDKENAGLYDTNGPVGDLKGQDDSLWTTEENEDGTVTVTGYTGTSPVVSIPDIIDGKTVSAIGVSAFDYSEFLLKVIIPDTVKTISDGAFGGCENLAEVVFGGSVEVIGESAFADCSSLQSAQLPDSLQLLDVNAFAGCTSLESVYIPANMEVNVYSGRPGPFAGCSALDSVAYGEGITRIPATLFEGSGISYVVIPPTVTEIGASAFSWCQNITEVVIPDTVKMIGQNAFAGCENLEEVTFGTDLQELGEGAFDNCPNLKMAIAVHPKSIFVPVEETAVINIAAVGDCQSYRWQVSRDEGDYWTDISSEVEGYDASELFMPMTAEQDGWLVRCVVTDESGGSLISCPAELKLFSVVTQPENAEIPAGSSVTFTVAATGSDLTYQWQYMSPVGSFWNDVSEESGTTASYSFTADRSYDGYLFQCVITCGAFSLCSDTATLSVLPVGWVETDAGWQYYNPDGTCTASQWKQIGGKWYHFDAEGIMQTGWQKIGGAWYYFSASGAMQTNWQKIGGTWYYFSASGAMQTGWQKIGGSYYYFNASGVMQSGWQQIGGKWYYLGSSGSMQTGWKQIGSVWYYFNAGGDMTTGWKTLDGKTYYFKENGAMAANEWCKGYWLNKDGTWTYKYKAGWKQDSRGWYYQDTSGWYAKNETIKIDGKSYTFDANGYLK